MTLLNSAIASIGTALSCQCNAASVADPTLLAVATGQARDNTAYDALDVPNLAAKSSYLDPDSGETIYRVTDGSYPETSDNGRHDYSSGGPWISQPWGAGGDEYTLLIHVRPPAASNTYWLIDFNLTTRVFSNSRLSPQDNDEIATAFSLKAGEEQILYYIVGDVLNRYDTAADTLANTGNFPHDFGSSGDVMWLTVDKNSEWFCVISNFPSDWPCLLWNSGTDAQLTYTGATSMDEPHIGKDGAVVALHVASNNMDFWDIDADTQSGVSPKPFQSHLETLEGGYVVYVDVEDTKIEVRMKLSDQTKVTIFDGTEHVDGSGHRSGLWLNRLGNDADSAKQWYLGSFWGGTSGKPGHESLILNRADGSDIRQLCHHYSSGSAYHVQPHAHLAPDGKLALFKSDMNVGGRGDVFMVIVPTS